jgi:hypothetical protein
LRRGERQRARLGGRLTGNRHIRRQRLQIRQLEGFAIPTQIVGLLQLVETHEVPNPLESAHLVLGRFVKLRFVKLGDSKYGRFVKLGGGWRACENLSKSLQLHLALRGACISPLVHGLARALKYNHGELCANDRFLVYHHGGEAVWGLAR